MNREAVRKFIDLLIENEKAQKPYDDLLSDKCQMYDVIYKMENEIARLLNIPDDVLDYLIRDYITWKAYDEFDKQITSIDELLDCIFRNYGGEQQ